MTVADSTTLLITVSMAYAMCLPLRTGLFSVAPAAFASIGGYCSALLMMKSGLSFPAATLGAIAMCAVIGALLTIPLARITGLYTAIATLAVLVVTQGVISSMGITGGSNGLIGIPNGDSRWLLLLIIAISAAGWFWLDHSQTGRRVDAVGGDAILAAARGIDVARIRAIGLTLSAATAGAVGAAYAHAFFVLTPTIFGFNFAIQIAAVAVVASAGHWASPLLAGILLGLVNQLMSDYANWGLAVNGAIMVAVIVLVPSGLSGPLRHTFRGRGLRGRLTARRNGDDSIDREGGHAAARA
ncbi:branched-chain amino acid ABC transporter permease [Conexibacter sp. CPCC 206217]|uniref:branched-chain amino acid ABC transporter permease n=1 Tax=Conexibacter sp. CPCC 206217 TaxID=3064574 RepID=UPI002724AE06|nr:branched-chain amino acid ABC transporter permease [Conexibacter sp. CPCC 206217]MDO8210124.1 branched-chain amino acid ABC transporter permease [Conexibacter sp. CPCC 206217]